MENKNIWTPIGLVAIAKIFIMRQTIIKGETCGRLSNVNFVKL